MWRKKIPYGVMKITWNEDLNILAAGLSNGNVICFGVWPEKKFKEYDEYVTIRNHTNAITGLGISKANGCVYSIARDKHLFITTINNVHKKW